MQSLSVCLGPAIVRKKLFLWHEVLVKMDCSLSGASDALKSALVLGIDSSVPDGDGGSAAGLNDCGVEVHDHWL